MRRDLPQDLCFPTYESVACSITHATFNTNMMGVLVMKLKRGKKAFVRVFGTIRATRKTGDKGVTVFHNLDADAISEVYISDSAPASAER